MNRISLIYFTFSILLFITRSFAQNQISYESRLEDFYKNYAKEGSFVLKGSVKNFKDGFVDFGLDGFVRQRSFSIAVDADGNFEQEFPISGVQKLYLGIQGGRFIFHVLPKDTIQLNWDHKDTKGTFALSSNNKVRNAILQTELSIIKNVLDDYASLVNIDLRDKMLAKEQAYAKINDMFNRTVELIIHDVARNERLQKIHFSEYSNLVAQQYFDYTTLLLSMGILDKTPLKIKSRAVLSFLTDSLVDQGKTLKYMKYMQLDTSGLGYKVEDENLLFGVPSYRNFLHNYLNTSSSDVFSYTLFAVPSPDLPKRKNALMKYYRSAKISLSSTLLRDWYMAKILDNRFIDSFDEAKEVYDLFIDECKTAYFKANIVSNYSVAQNLKPGLAAPSFTLKDEKGNNVSLSDFKSKVVYIDFWGVDCGSCIYEIENFKETLHNNYKDRDVVFLNICVDGDTKSWMSSLSKMKLNGINLIAQGWANHPVCKAYNVVGIPHYVIINKDGTIANQHAPRMIDLVSSLGSNELDSALSMP